MSDRYRDRHWLEVMYHGRELTQREMAERCGVSPRTIRTYMKEFDIPTREVRGRNHGLYGRERDEETRRKISESLGVGISRQSGENASPRRSPGERFRPTSVNGSPTRSPVWNGRRRLDAG